MQSTTNLTPCDQEQLLTNELVCVLQKTTVAYNEGEFDDYSYNDGYYDACLCVWSFMNCFQYSEDAITEFKQYSEKAYKAVDESMYDGDHDEEDYYDGFYKGIGDAVNYLGLDHSRFKEFKLWEEKIEDNDSLQDR